MDELPYVIIYSDGSCSPNPGPGGWGAVLISERHGVRREISGADPATTNNRMELTAAIEALKRLNRRSRVDLYTDSQYLRNAFEQGWIAKWQRNGWQTRARKPVLNQDLWRELIELTEKHEVRWHWVRGHSDHPENDRVDALANAARETLKHQGRG